VVLRFRGEDDAEPIFVGATSDPELARAVAERLVAEAEAAAEVAAGDDETLATIFRAEAARVRTVLDALGVGPLRIVPESK
jgi:hypothetical protein